MHVLTATPLNPAQRRAVEHVHGPMLVLAGAGSGKTRVLTARIARLIESEGVPADRIFAVTFTNKAAGEMRERVGRLLGREPTGLWIGTFHALSARLLRREAERLGFTRQFTIYDEDDQQRLIRRLMDEHDITVFAGVPTMYWALLGALDAAKAAGVDVEKLARTMRRAISGGAALPVEILTQFKDRFDVQILEGYGLSVAESLPLEIAPSTEFTRRYLKTKKDKLGHTLNSV